MALIGGAVEQTVVATCCTFALVRYKNALVSVGFVRDSFLVCYFIEGVALRLDMSDRVQVAVG